MAKDPPMPTLANGSTTSVKNLVVCRTELKSPRAFLGAKTGSLPIKRHEDTLEIEVKGKGDLRLVEKSIPPRDDTEKAGRTRTTYYSKAGRSESSAKLDL